MEVKVCNLRSPEFKQEFIDSLTTTGFAVITHHGVDFDLIREAQNAWKSFFKADENYKEYFVNRFDPNMGYTGRLGEKAVGASKADLKEFFHWKPKALLPIELSGVTSKLYYALEDVAGQMLSALSGIGSSLNYQEVCQNSNNTLLRSLYYPALEDFQETGDAVRAAAHEDINFITLLIAASAPGLQVLDSEGKWHDVPHEENSIVVNIGDMLQVASNNVLKSTTHRVVNPENNFSDRVSIPLFIHPHGDTIIAPGLTAQDFLNERLNAIYKTGYNKENK